ncbi:hypothetical protein [Gorillibacterium sp. sgz5001074]|uniref:hypothetical protein n=1 Tax=Gorillibacterium sp. sgz5001074 TaxID=3446695 RepID=UPI003F661A03
MAKAEKKKYEVIKVFRDRITGKRYVVGDEYESDQPNRVEELQAGGYLADDTPKQQEQGDGEQNQTVPGVSGHADNTGAG